MFNEIILTSVFFLLLTPVYAGVNVSASAVDGSPSLRFDRVMAGANNTKQIRVRMNANDGKQYQVFQRLLGPLMNEKGESLNLMAIETASMGGSNASGTLYMQNIDHLSYTEQLVYTSGRAGESDAFVIAYSPRPDLLNASGHFTGRLIFSIREAGSAGQDEISMDISLDSVGTWKMTIEGGKNPKQIKLSDANTSISGSDYVHISFSGNTGNNVRIYQEFESFPQNEAGEELRPDALVINIDGASAGIRSQGMTALSRSRTLIYSGSEAKDDLRVYFTMNPDAIAQLSQGIYRGKIKYVTESDQGASEFIIDIECQINPIFSLDITSLSGDGLSFGRILPMTPVLEKEITVTIRSNLHKPYQVVQHMVSPLTNEQGKEFDKKYFSFKVNLDPGSTGNTRYGDLSTVEVGDYPIYSSDGKGGAVTFKVVYQLKGYAGMSPGNFQVPLTFSLNQN